MSASSVIQDCRIALLLAGLRHARNPHAIGMGRRLHHPSKPSAGATLYANECASCHGSALSGGESAPPLTGGEFFSNWNGLTVGDLFDRIRVSMPADRSGKLTREQDADILAFMLSVNQFPAGKPNWSTGPRC